MNNFDAAEIVRFAVRIEENGEKFYRFAATLSDEEDTRYLFNYLADEELKHKQFFGSILSKLDLSSLPFETYQGEYIEYMRNYLDRQIIFSKAKEQEAKEITDMLSAVNFAMDRETDSILFYSEIKKLVPDKQHEKIEEIINEERRHFVKLANFRKEIEL